MPEPVKTRRYDSPTRRANAEQTRLAVLAAARELFAARGWAGTSVAAVAREAGVAVDTVYASVGRKPALLVAVVDMELAGSDRPVAAEERDYVIRIRAASSAAERIRTYAAALAERLPRVVPLLLALKSAAAADEECARTYDAITGRRLSNMRLFAADLRSTGELRAGLTDEDVALLVWSTNSPEYFQLLADRGIPAERYRDLVVDLWTRTLLTPG